MYTNTFNAAAYNEVCNSGLVYDRSGEARAVVCGHNLIMTLTNVQHTFHVETPIEDLARCWSNLVDGLDHIHPMLEAYS